MTTLSFTIVRRIGVWLVPCHSISWIQQSIKEKCTEKWKKTRKKHEKENKKQNIPWNNFEVKKIHSGRFFPQNACSFLFESPSQHSKIPCFVPIFLNFKLEFSPLSCMVYGKSLDPLLRFFFIVFHLSQITMPLVNNTLLIRKKVRLERMKVNSLLSLSGPDRRNEVRGSIAERHTANPTQKRLPS